MSNIEDGKGQNIKVVLRCRPMTNAEATKEKPAIKCVSDKHVEVNYGMVGKTSKKSFTFDGVYDEKSSQKQVYEGVVRPVVDEVLQGYNCTVFAYGQTGTGKTHTMEGDVNAAPAGVMQPNAGIIPRAVTQVFKYLEENEFEYTVRISVVELYNEELADLIASADDGSNAGNLRKLRLMEDPKKGIVLQGVEERAAKDAKDVFNLLECTNKQRRTAETLCNKQSSRSHQIFTLKIFMKEKTLDEEEIIKTGTLNLVDLAGSECVGRSGALGDRKKEAGQINQSLLTLGRVITALVEHQPHVPYRESKLTRLLQESLGGKTKTCIIATVSPTSGNIEETLGTLDYACRAKNIKNTPEINQVQTKKTMMRDMSKYIADLQEQLKSQRDNTGVFLPNGKYEELQIELKRLTEVETVMQTELDEKLKQYQELQEAFDDTCGQLEDTRSDLKQTQNALVDTEHWLDSTKKTLHKTEVKLGDTSLVLTEHKQIGDELYTDSTSLLAQSVDMKKDIKGLFGKISRKDQVEIANDSIASGYTADLYQQVDVAGKDLKTFKTDQESKFKGLQRLVAEFVVEKNEEMAGLKRAVAELQTSSKNAMVEQSERVAAANEASKVSLDDMELLAAEQREEEAARVRGCASEVALISGRTAKEIESAESGIAAWAARILSGLQDNESEVQDFVKGQTDKLKGLEEHVETQHNAHQEALQQDRSALEFMVTAQEAALLEMQHKLAAQMQGLIASALSDHQSQMAVKVSGIIDSMQSTENNMTCAHTTTSGALSSSLAAVSALSSAHQTRVRGERTASEAGKAVLVKSVAQLSELNTATLGAVHKCQDDVEMLQQHHADATRSSVEATVSSSAQLAGSTCDSIAAEADLAVNGCQDLMQMLDHSDASANCRGEALSSAVDEQSEASQHYFITAQTQMGYMRAHELRLRKDESTGETPRKKELALPSTMPAFRADREVIAALRGFSVDEAEELDAPLARELSQASNMGAEDSEHGSLDAASVKSVDSVKAVAAEEAFEVDVLEEKEESMPAPAAVVPLLAVKEVKDMSAPPRTARSARGTGPKEAIPSKISRIPSVRSSRDVNKENTRNHP